MERNERIEALETKLSYQEAALADMSALVNEYRLRVERMERTLANLSGKLRELDDGKEGGLPQGERPPHY